MSGSTPGSGFRSTSLLSIGLVLTVGAGSAAAQQPIYETFGDTAGEFFGRTIATGMDLDGDGIGDLVVGAPRDDDPEVFSGEVHIRSGADGSVIGTINFTQGFNNFGSETRFLGDVDGDLVPDFAVMKHAGIGEVFVYSGATNTVLYAVPVTPPQASPWRVLSECPDLDGDGVLELIVGEPQFDTVTVYSGADGSVLDTLLPPFLGLFGRFVDWVPDVDGDGTADILVGIPNAFTVGGVDAGAVALFSGADRTLIRVDQGLFVDAQFGHAVTGVEDVNGDGAGDYLVGSPWKTILGRQVGTAELISGGDGAVLWSQQSTFLNSGYGMTLTAIGDFDGDGRPDGATSVPFGGFERVEVFDLGTGAPLGVFRRSQSFFGLALEPLGDVNGDGRDDLAVGSSREDGPVLLQSGSVLALRACERTGHVVCDSTPNSTSLTGTLSACVEDDVVHLHAGQLPFDQPGFFLMGQVPASTPLFDGILCLGIPFVRLSGVPGGLADSGSGAEVFLDLDLTALPQNTVVLPGETWRFQYWTRDRLGGVVDTADFTTAIEVAF